MADVSMVLDDRAFVEAMKQTQRETGKTTKAIMKDMMRLWVESLVRWTMPKKPADGKKAIAVDQARIFMPMDNESALRKWQEESDQQGKWFYRKSKNGKTYRFNRAFLNFSLQKMAAWHRQNRTKRGRTVKLRRSDQAWNGKMVVPTSLLEKWVKRLWKHSGRTKSGWIAGLRDFGGKGPAWVEKHFNWGSVRGDAYNGFRDDLDGQGWAENRVPWIRDYNGMMRRSLQMRLKDLTSGKYVARWHKAVKKASA